MAGQSAPGVGLRAQLLPVDLSVGCLRVPTPRWLASPRASDPAESKGEPAVSVAAMEATPCRLYNVLLATLLRLSNVGQKTGVSAGGETQER